MSTVKIIDNPEVLVDNSCLSEDLDIDEVK